MKVIVK